MFVSSPNPLAPLLGLPTYSGGDEERRLLIILATAPHGVSFVTLAAGANDPVGTYGALFSLLTHGGVVSVELPDGAVGYRPTLQTRSTGVATATARPRGVKIGYEPNPTLRAYSAYSG